MKKAILIVAFWGLLLPQGVFASDIPGVTTPIPITPQNYTPPCPTGYYIYQRPLQSNAPTLADLFDKKAHFQSLTESQTLQFTPWIAGPSKMNILYNPDDNKYYGFSRAVGGNSRLTTYFWSSPDGLTFTPIAPIFSDAVIQEVGDEYDPHIAIDYSVCPVRYIMTLENAGQLAVSTSTTPFVPTSWSKPKVLVNYILDNLYGTSYVTNKESASTGVTLIDGTNKYVSWTVVARGPIDASWGIDPTDGVFKKLRDIGTESTYSRGIQTTDILTYLGISNIGNILLPAETNTHCISSWDCNNRDKQDWIKEGNYYYLIYNGANYYGCTRFAGDTATNDWGIGIARSTSPLSGYDLSGVGEIISADMHYGCDVSYPLINNIGGELYMYYVHGYQLERSKLVWNPPYLTIALKVNGLSGATPATLPPATVTLTNAVGVVHTFTATFTNNGSGIFTSNVDTTGASGGNQVTIKFPASLSQWLGVVSLGSSPVSLNATANPLNWGNVNGDNKIDILDLTGIINNRTSTSVPASGSPADLNGDGVIDSTDLAIFLQNYTHL